MTPNRAWYRRVMPCRSMADATTGCSHPRCTRPPHSLACAHFVAVWPATPCEPAAAATQSLGDQACSWHFFVAAQPSRRARREEVAPRSAVVLAMLASAARQPAPWSTRLRSATRARATGRARGQRNSGWWTTRLQCYWCGLCARRAAQPSHDCAGAAWGRRRGSLPVAVAGADLRKRGCCALLGRGAAERSVRRRNAAAGCGWARCRHSRVSAHVASRCAFVRARTARRACARGAGVPRPSHPPEQVDTAAPRAC